MSETVKNPTFEEICQLILEYETLWFFAGSSKKKDKNLKLQLKTKKIELLEAIRAFGCNHE